jgi:hypothetical protein
MLVLVPASQSSTERCMKRCSWSFPICFGFLSSLLFFSGSHSDADPFEVVLVDLVFPLDSFSGDGAGDGRRGGMIRVFSTVEADTRRLFELADV